MHSIRAFILLALLINCSCDRDSDSAAALPQPASSGTTVAEADQVPPPKPDLAPIDAPKTNEINGANVNSADEADKPADAPVADDAQNAADAPVADDAQNAADAPVADDAQNAADAPVADDAHGTANPGDADIRSMDALSESQRSIVNGITWDLPPEVLNAVLKENEGGHFLFSDEKHPEMFRETIENLGGTYMGIGTDQGYVFIGWQRPTLAFLVDYDPWVVIVHKLYMALFKVCDSGDCILSYFEDPEKGREFIKSCDELSDRETLAIYKDAQRGITNRLRNIRRMKEKTFMNDADTFDYIKKLIETGRLTTYQANLLGDRAFASTREAMQKLGAQMTVLYLSNAEQYWRYSDQYRKNMSELDYSDNAYILRTIATKPVNGDYRYSAQKADLFKSWIVLPTTHTYKDFVGYTRNKDPEVFPFTIETKQPPQDAAANPQAD